MRNSQKDAKFNLVLQSYYAPGLKAGHVELEGLNEESGRQQGERKRWRRKRTVFSSRDIEVLERVYEQHKFLNPSLVSIRIFCSVTVSQD